MEKYFLVEKSALSGAMHSTILKINILTSQRGLQVVTLYVAGSRSIRHVSERHRVRRTLSECLGDIFCTVNSV